MARTDLLTPNERITRRAPLTDVRYACNHVVPEDRGRMSADLQAQVLDEAAKQKCPRCRMAANATRHNETPEARAARTKSDRKLWD